MKANATIELLLKHIKQALIHEICAAKSSVIVVQSWFTDQDLLNELQIHAAAGRRVEVVIASEDLNGTLDLSQLIKSGGRVKSVARHKLRNTFCVLDNCTVAVGSYNWTYRGAADTFKNLFLIRNAPTFALQCYRAFNDIIADNQASELSHNLDLATVELAYRVSGIEFEIGLAEAHKKRASLERLRMRPPLLHKPLIRLYNQCVVALGQSGCFRVQETTEDLLQVAYEYFLRCDEHSLTVLLTAAIDEQTGNPTKNHRVYLTKRFNIRLRYLKEISAKGAPPTPH